MNFIRIIMSGFRRCLTFISTKENDISSFSSKPLNIIKMETSRNEFLWRKAKKRASFKRHLQTYLIVNSGLWLIYALMSIQPWGHHAIYPWPIWPMFGWGIGLVSHYLSAYGRTDERRSAEIEYEKLIRSQK